MKMWQRPSLAMVAILALLASFLPQLAWSCPLTRQISAAPMTCAMPSSPSSSKAAPHCTKCCRPVSLPAPRDENHPSYAAASAFAAAIFAAPHSPSQPFVPVTSEFPLLSPATGRFSVCSAHGPPRLSVHRSPLVGRAPPVL